MKPEDQAAFDEAERQMSCDKFSAGWQAALAHRDAQPTVAQWEAVAWVNSANLKSAAISRERGGPFEQHTWSENKTAYHDVPLWAHEAPAVAVNEQTLSELKNMVRAYVRLLESGKDRIESLGGECDPVDRMEASDSNLRTAKAAIAAAEKAKGGV